MGLTHNYVLLSRYACKRRTAINAGEENRARPHFLCALEHPSASISRNAPVVSTIE